MGSLLLLACSMRNSILLLLALTPFLNGATTTSITQAGVTFNFSNAVTFGQFVTGEYWVADAGSGVEISSITPAFSSGDEDNGWEVNPAVDASQGFDGGAVGYSAGLVPSLPYTASAGESIVKAVSAAVEAQPYLDTVVVLTVLASAPSDGADGANTFRPPYMGTDKTQYTTSDVNWSKLPSLSSAGVTNIPTLATVAAYWDAATNGIWHDIHTSQARDLRPSDAIDDDYYPSQQPKIFDTAMRLMLDDSQANKETTMYRFLNHCLDRLFAMKQGYTTADQGHNPGHRFQAGWAAAFFDLDSDLTTLAALTGRHAEKYIYENVNGVAVWGETSTEAQYWNYIMGLGGSRSRKDPYAYIDGGDLDDQSGGASVGGARYQIVTAQSFKAQVLGANLVPDIQKAYKSGHWGTVDEYARRWVDVGVWATPDPVAPYDGNNSNYSITYGPDPDDTPYEYIAGAGRFPTKHGVNADGGQYKSSFIASMWDNYIDYMVGSAYTGQLRLDQSGAMPSLSSGAAFKLN